jgi:NTE family protein
VRLDLGFLPNARQALLPLPLVDRRAGTPAAVLPPLEPDPAAPWAGERVAVVGTDGGAGSVAMIGLARALEESGARPALISTCSGSALWGAMWAAGMSAEEMADCALAWRPEDHLGVQWTGLPRFAASALRGFSGLAKARAVEQLFPRHVWRMSAGATEVPFQVLAHDLESGRSEPLGSVATPELTLGELVRVAVASPHEREAVRIEGRFYSDAGAAERPSPERLLDGAGFDRVLDAGTGPSSFYGLFLDRRRWPELIRGGYDAARRTRPRASPS